MALKKSVLWSHFAKLHQDLASCNETQANKTPCTTDLAQHLKTHHLAEYCELLEQNEVEPSDKKDGLPSYSCSPENGQKISRKSALAEISSLLSIAMSRASVSLLYDEEDENNAVAVEVRPSVRSFEFKAPPAKWSAVIFWQPSKGSGTSNSICVSILKMGRQIIECRNFDPGQTLEVVEFVKSHSIVDAKWVLCQGMMGSSRVATFSECYTAGESIERSVNCEMLVSAEETVCSHCAEAQSHDGVTYPLDGVAYLQDRACSATGRAHRRTWQDEGRR